MLMVSAKGYRGEADVSFASLSLSPEAHIDCGLLLRVERRGAARLGQTIAPGDDDGVGGAADDAQKRALRHAARFR